MRVEPLQRRFLVWKIGLGFLALGTSFDVFFHKLLESGSFIRLLHKLPGVQDPWMASCRAIVDFSQHSSSFLNVVFEKKFSDCWFGVRKKSVVKEDTRLIGIHLLVKVLSLRKEIGNGVGITRDVGKFVVEILEIFNPSCLMTSNLLGLAEVLKVFVISANLNRVCSAQVQRVTTFKPEDYSGELFIVRVVVLFGREEAS
jgi:hypothetical protein